jgi:hypothetical protein
MADATINRMHQAVNKRQKSVNGAMKRSASLNKKSCRQSIIHLTRAQPSSYPALFY